FELDGVPQSDLSLCTRFGRLRVLGTFSGTTRSTGLLTRSTRFRRPDARSVSWTCAAVPSSALYPRDQRIVRTGKPFNSRVSAVKTASGELPRFIAPVSNSLREEQACSGFGCGRRSIKCRFRSRSLQELNMLFEI